MALLLLRRLGSAALTLLLASLVVFVVMDRLPGNAAQILLGTAAREDTTAALQHNLGLDRPAPARYVDWIAGLATGDLGQSVSYSVPVGGLIAQRLAVTLPLALIAVALSSAAGLGLGVAAAAGVGRWPDRGVAVFAQIGLAVPDFWAGLLLILVFSTLLGWVHAGGFPGWAAGPWQALQALALPALALALPQAAVLARVARGAVLDVAREDFVRSARARGMAPHAVLWRHVVPNALAPVITIVGLQFSFLIAGAVLVENVFALPGIGQLAYAALAQRDLVVVRDLALLFAALVIGVNLGVDLLCVALDPRLQGRG